jgi:hypothetical protein
MMTGIMMGSAPSVVSGEMSVLRSLARLLDPEAGPEITKIAESLPREDVKTAILGLRELLEWITALTPVQPVIAAAVEDLQHREAVLAEREAKLVKREQRAARVAEALTDLTAEMTIERLEKAEYDLVAAIALPATTPTMREKAVAVLAKLRSRKAELLKANPEVLRKSSKVAAPHWIGLPSVAAEVTAMVKAARDRQSEERRIAKRAGAVGNDIGSALSSIRAMLRAPIVGERNLVGFLNRYAAP